jgi:hypothetical protein
MPEGRRLYGLASHANEIYIAGGVTDPTGSPPKNTLWKYNPMNDEFIELSPMNHGRSGIDLEYWNNSLFAFTNPSARSWEIYSISDENWTEIAPSPIFIYSYNDCEAVDDVFYFFSEGWGKLEAYSPVNGSRWDVSSLDSHLGRYPTAYLDGNLFLFGGFQDIGWYVENSTRWFNISDGLWMVGTPMSTPRHWSSAVAVNDLIYVLGGIDDTGIAISDVEAYCPYNDTWVSFPSMQIPRAYFRSGYADGHIYSFGGSDAHYNTVYSSVERLPVSLPDLGIVNSDIRIHSEGRILDGVKTELEITVENLGDWPARSVNVRLEIDDDLKNQTRIDFIDSGDSIDIGFNITPETGEHSISIHLDPENWIEEESVENNIVNTNIS